MDADAPARWKSGKTINWIVWAADDIWAASRYYVDTIIGLRLKMAIQTRTAMSVDEYFEWEQLQERKHEYIDGVVIEMPGVSNKHSLITTNLIYLFVAALDRLRYTLHMSELRVQISPTRYVYPDLTLVRGASNFADPSEYNLMNPFFVVEVTSPTSMDRDRQEKLEYYYEVPSIDAYLIVDQHRLFAELHTRGESGWLSEEFADPTDVISLKMLECELPLDQVYRDIVFE
ncbi:MAG: Uma2 family endonuclease [Chloroflexota bacterium]|nr:Uma2 family endonuclease [Chloroflexota bacterium]